MTNPEPPKDGDFASYLETRWKTPATTSSGAAADHSSDHGSPFEKPRQTIHQVLVEGQEPTEEFLEEWNALENAPELSDDELARQALDAPGDDGDTQTPE
jgi:hypothetical protein